MGVALLLGALAWGQVGAVQVGVQVENDLFGDGFDRHYTNGLRINAISDGFEWTERLARLFPLYKPSGRIHRATWGLGQSIFTPEDITRRTLDRRDRPYAGWLYTGPGLVVKDTSNPDYTRVDQLEFNLGMIGPYSLADEVQSRWHLLIGSPRPHGWSYQLKNELGFNAYSSRQWIFTLPGSGVGRLQVIPNLSYAVGTLHTHLGAGAMVRFGSGLGADYGPPTIRPSLPSGGFYEADQGFHWNLFAGVGGRWVLRNLFLDGNTFTDSHSVDKRPLVGDIQAGLVVTVGGLRIAFTNVWRTREFRGQSSATEFGSITLSFDW